jgi:uridylate kinase
MDRTTADYMGMLATVINGMAPERVGTDWGGHPITKQSRWLMSRAVHFAPGDSTLELGRVVILEQEPQSIFLDRYDGGTAGERNPS